MGGRGAVYIFDLDGTLLDTLRDLAASVNYAMERCHYPTHTINEVCSMVGNGVVTLIKRAVPSGTSEEDTARALDYFRKHYMKHSEDTTRPYDGILELLSSLKAKGKHIAVVSNKFEIYIQQRILAFHVSAFSGDSVTRSSFKLMAQLCLLRSQMRLPLYHESAVFEKK